MRLDVLLGEIDPGFQMGQGFEHLIAGRGGAAAEVAFELTARGAQGQAGLGGYQIHHPLRLGEVQLAIQEGALGELAGARRDRPAGQQTRQHLAGHQHPAVTGEFDAVLAGKTVRCAENQHQPVIQRVS